MATFLLIPSGLSSVDSRKNSSPEAIQENLLHSMEKNLPQQSQHWHIYLGMVKVKQKEEAVEKAAQAMGISRLGWGKI